jgi:alkanesulfonate monooxygenase SsuD/methylene tetrahydromethanopterin reductase-like flavin-dependent oxidoreductase (luciferase family)
VHIGLSGWSRAAADPDPERFLDLMQRADALGFDSIWLSEHHFRREGLPYPAPLLLAAAIFARTERVRVGLGVALPAIHHPLLLAEELAQLDVQSGGRLDVGLGRSNQPEVPAALGIDTAEQPARIRAAIEILVRAWTDGIVSVDGPFWRFEEVEVGPRPIQQPHPPLYIGGTSPESMRLATSLGLPLLLSLEPPEGRQLDRYREAAAQPGCPAPVRDFSLARYVCVAPTDAEADALVDRLLPLLIERRRWAPPFESFAAAKADFLSRQAIAGAPERCVEQIGRLVAETGIGHLRCVFNGNGGLDRETTLAGMDLFAHDVLPACRHILPPAADSGGTTR